MPENTFAPLVWDATGEKRFETGASNGVLYLGPDGKGGFTRGYVWNGLTGVDENPSGAEENKLFADNIKYASLRSAEEFGCTVNAYTYPDEFMACDGSKEIAPGVYAGQQNRETFGFSYQTVVGDDTDNNKGHKIHLVYGCSASPSGKQYQTINDSPDAITFSWEVSTVPVPVTGIPGVKALATLTIDSTKIADQSKFEALKKILYGSAEANACLPCPDEVLAIFTAA